MVEEKAEKSKKYNGRREEKKTRQKMNCSAIFLNLLSLGCQRKNQYLSHSHFFHYPIVFTLFLISSQQAERQRKCLSDFSKKKNELERIDSEKMLHFLCCFDVDLAMVKVHVDYYVANDQITQKLRVKE